MVMSQLIIYSLVDKKETEIIVVCHYICLKLMESGS